MKTTDKQSDSECFTEKIYKISSDLDYISETKIDEIFLIDSDHMNDTIAPSLATSSPPACKREPSCPNAPQRPTSFAPRLTSETDPTKTYTNFPTTCVWKRLGLKQLREEAEVEHQNKRQKTNSTSCEKT